MFGAPVVYDLWPQENFRQLWDEFAVLGCRVLLVGAHLVVETDLEGADPQAVARSYAEQLRVHIGYSRLLTQEELGRLPFQTVMMSGLTAAERSVGLARLQEAPRAVVAPVDGRLSQCYDYFQSALHSEEHALSYLYKMIESIEEEYGGEADTVRALGSEIRGLKRLANDRGVGSRDQRHAPLSPGTAAPLSVVERDKALDEGRSILRRFAEARSKP